MANSFINKKVDLTTTDLTTLYTVPSARTAVVKSLLVSKTQDQGHYSNYISRCSSDAYLVYLKTKAVASKATTELLTQPLVLQESEALKYRLLKQMSYTLLLHIRNTTKGGNNIVRSN